MRRKEEARVSMVAPVNDRHSMLWPYSTPLLGYLGMRVGTGAGDGERTGKVTEVGMEKAGVPELPSITALCHFLLGRHFGRYFTHAACRAQATCIVFA